MGAGSKNTSDNPLEPYQIANSGRCWWCGDVATTSEHKFKHSDLRRVAGESKHASNVYKFSETYNGLLRSLNKGSQVRWGKNLCAQCNNATSQPFDRAYDRFVEYLLDSFEVLYQRRGVDWTDIFGDEWQQGVHDLSRYLVKQFCCMMATKNLAVPSEAIEFLNGSHHEGPVNVLIWRDWKFIHLLRNADKYQLPSDVFQDFYGLPPTKAYIDPEDETELTGADYCLRIGYVMFTVTWRAKTESVSMHDVQRIKMPLINGDRKSRREWKAFMRSVPSSESE